MIVYIPSTELIFLTMIWCSNKINIWAQICGRLVQFLYHGSQATKNHLGARGRLCFPTTMFLIYFFIYYCASISTIFNPYCSFHRSFESIANFFLLWFSVLAADLPPRYKCLKSSRSVSYSCMDYIGISTPLPNVAGKPSIHVRSTLYSVVDAIAQWTPVPRENMELRSYLRSRLVGSFTATGGTR